MDRILSLLLPLEKRIDAELVLHPRRALTESRIAVEVVHRFERRRPEHVRRVIHPADEITVVAPAPLDEDPAFEVFEKSVRVIEPLEELHEAVDLLPRDLLHPLVARAPDVVAELENVPHGPVRDVDAVVVVRGIAHRDHPLGQIRRLRGEGVVFEEALLDEILPREERLGAGGDIAVSEPSGALAVRAVGENALHV